MSENSDWETDVKTIFESLKEIVEKVDNLLKKKKSTKAKNKP